MALLVACLLAAVAPRVQAGSDVAAPARADLREGRPNVVLFLVDDLGWQDTSVAFHSRRTRFNDHFRTPNMERLAERGVKFTQAYAAAVCSPSRTSILTGQNPARHGVTQWTLFADRETSGRTERLRAPDGWRREGLQPDDVTLPRLLQREGYRTIHCGKAHWGAYDTPGADPANLGFDVNIAGHAAGAPGHYEGARNFGNAESGEHVRPWGVPGLAAYHGTDTHLSDALTLEAVRAVASAVADERPFFLYMAHYAVHAPIQVHRPHDEAYRDRCYPGTEVAIADVEARYASMVAGVDASLGVLLDELEELDVARRTLVLFASDNGGLTVHSRGTTPDGTGANTHNAPLREGKGSAYEGGTRIPLLISWAQPDSEEELQQRLPVASGGTRATPTICEDWFPTLLAWAGAAAPRDHAIDGVDLTPLLAPEPPSPTDAPAQPRPLVFHYPHVWGPRGRGYQPHSALRLGDWKAIYFYEGREWELYDLAADPGEREDLAARHPRRLRELAAELRRLLEERGARFPARIGTGEPELPAWPR